MLDKEKERRGRSPLICCDTVALISRTIFHVRIVVRIRISIYDRRCTYNFVNLYYIEKGILCLFTRYIYIPTYILTLFVIYIRYTYTLSFI